ncbi:MAG: hypothetical protein FWB80_00170 [Defluviitaleaceae bacterium]|nr:hypothetical protein [Defluviitaleaceae bacterium]
MDNTFYFYYGIVQEWLRENGATPEQSTTTTQQEQPRQIYTFDQLPKGYW